MSYVAISENPPATGHEWMLGRSRSGQEAGASLACRIEDRQFLRMHRAFAASGGLINGDQVALRMRRHVAQPISALARRVVERSVLNIAWASQTLLPWFQFDASNMSVRPVVRTVIEELVPVFDDWELTLWFAEPNVWLQDARPVDLALCQPDAVVGAARADRYVAAG